MKRLLLSVVALLFATLMFTLSEVNQDDFDNDEVVNQRGFNETLITQVIE